MPGTRFRNQTNSTNQASWISHSTSFPWTEQFWLLLLPTTPLPHNWTITLNYFLKVVCAICHITRLDFCFLLSSGECQRWGTPNTEKHGNFSEPKFILGKFIFLFLLLWTCSLVKNVNNMERIPRSFWSNFRYIEVKDIRLYEPSSQKQILWLWIWVSWSLKGQGEVGTLQFNLS